MTMFPLIELSGSAFERGRIHGQQARGRVERSLANYASLFAHYGMDWTAAQRRGAEFRDVIGGFDAALLEELEGIAHGAHRHIDELLALNARTEIMPAGFLAQAGVGECTAIAISPRASSTGGTLLAQNWDWLGTQRDALVLLRIRGNAGPDCMTLTEAGMLGKIGLNETGFGVCLNILSSIFDGKRPGVPVHVLLRALLKRSSVQDAIEFASKFSYGSSSNALCADLAGDSAGLEFAPKGLRVVRGDGATLCHTNHFLDQEARAWQSVMVENLASEPRLACAQRHAAARPQHGIEDVKRLLRDETDGLVSVCRRPDPSMPAQARVETVASVVMELARGVMHVAPDVPSRAEYQPVALSAEAIPA
ncbi:MAG: C45 family peptidase [Betaproteobacteria bacterium]